MDKEVDITGAVIPSKHRANQPKAPPTVITTRFNCVHYCYSYHSSYFVEQNCVSDPLHSSLDKTLIYDT